MTHPLTTHGRSPWRLYRVWDAMLTRCRHYRYHRYAGRGITVCEEWQKFIGFRDWALANGYADDLTIERINNDGNYEPSNCRWATAQDQARNRVTSRAVIRSDGMRFSTIAAAVEHTPKASSANLIKACKYQIKTHAGFGWVYEED